MLGAPHLAHAAVPEPLDQVIAAKLLRLLQAAADAMKHLGGHDDDKGACIARPAEDEQSHQRSEPARRASQTMRCASGSNEAATREAPSICRGTPGAIIAKMRISSAIQDGRPISGASGGIAGIAQALTAAMSAAFISIIARPSVLLCSTDVSARRRYQRMIAEPTDADDFDRDDSPVPDPGVGERRQQDDVEEQRERPEHGGDGREDGEPCGLLGEEFGRESSCSTGFPKVGGRGLLSPGEDLPGRASYPNYKPGTRLRAAELAASGYRLWEEP